MLGEEAANIPCSVEKFKDTKEVLKIRKSKDMQYNGQKKKDKQ
jgi:hypothetical protein